MANEYLVNSEDMTAVADAIRSKGGTSDALEFPGGFVDAVGAIQTGGGNDLYYSLIDGSITEIDDDTSNVLRAGAFANCGALTKASFEKVTNIGLGAFESCSVLSEINLSVFDGMLPQRVFQLCKKLSTVNVYKITSIANSAFNNCAALAELYCPYCDKIYNGAFTWSGLERGYFPALTSIEANALTNVSNLKIVDLGNITNIPGTIINPAKSFEALILRSNTLCTLAGATNINNTPLTGVDGVYSGHVYVPSALISSYQTTTNWATLYANYPEIFQPIEGSEYE